jgi:hypothetical protein
VWLDGSINLTRTISDNLSKPYALFVTTAGDIYVDNGYSNGRVDKWTSSTNTSVPAMYVGNACYGLFVDTRNTLYCSICNLHQVVTKSLNSGTNVVTIVAGTGCPGSVSNMLHSPYGIFVSTNFDLYVADCGNDRVQLFPSGQLNGTTVARNGAPGTIPLNCPTAVVLDGDNYLFIVDSYNNRIVGPGPNGFRCLVGCSGSGSASNQLSDPQSMAFDSFGNIFVTNWGNARVQKFIFVNNTLGKCNVLSI